TARTLQATEREGAHSNNSLSFRARWTVLPTKTVRLLSSKQSRLLSSVVAQLLLTISVFGGPTAEVRFTDVTEKAGINFRHVASPEKKYIVESMSGGVALFDYDNDGLLDIYFVNSLTVDMVKSGGKTKSALYHNNGDGTFTDVTDRAGVGDIAWGREAAVVGYDNGGVDDLSVDCAGDDTLYHNNGDGTFTDVSKKAGVSDPDGYYGLGVICSDFDDDGLVDIYVANDSTPNFLYHNNGDGTFKEIGFTSGTAVNDNGSEQGSMGVTLGDYDHDGRLDLFVTNFADEYNTLYHADAKNSFTDLSYKAHVAETSLAYVGWGTKFFDYDNDGWVDLFVANGHVYPQLENYRQRKLVHHNNS